MLILICHQLWISHVCHTNTDTAATAAGSGSKQQQLLDEASEV